MALDALNEADDEMLLSAFAGGDAQAGQVLLTRFSPAVLGHAMRLLGNRAMAEDITQEVMIRLWKIAPNWEAGRARVSTWLYRVTANLCVDQLRAQNRFDGGEVPDVEDETPSVTEKMQSNIRQKALQQGLDQLPARQKQAVILRHIEGLSNPEIAQIMDIGVEAVESLTARGKRALAKILKPQQHALGLSDG